MMNNSNSLKGHMAIGIAALFWGLMAPVCKLVLNAANVSSIALAGLRLVGACVLFWGFSCFMCRESVQKRDHVYIFLAALFGILFNQMAFTIGVGFTAPTDAAIITTTTPILTMFLSLFVLKEVVTSSKVCGLCLSSLGALLLIYHSHAHAVSMTGENHLLGNLLCVFSQSSVAIYFVCFKGFIDRYSPFTLLKWMFTYATVLSLLIIVPELLSVNYSELSIQTWSGILYVIILSTFLCYILLSFAQQRLNPTTVSMYSYVQPVVASAATLWWGLESFNIAKCCAACLVVIGVFLVSYNTSPSQTALCASCNNKK